MHGRSRAGQIIDLMDGLINVERVNDVVFDEFEIGIAFKMGYIFFTSGEKIVNTNNAIPLLEQPFAQMTPNKPRPARD